jgi:hypothetical protein
MAEEYVWTSDEIVRRGCEILQTEEPCNCRMWNLKFVGDEPYNATARSHSNV